MIQGYKISSDKKNMNIKVIHDYLSRSYWSKDIPLKIVQKAIDNSLCFGVFLEEGEQVGFARIVTDSATFAYIADIFILEEHQAKGLSKWLMKTMLNHPEVKNIRRILLATRDAHGLYKQFDFKELSSPQFFMELLRPNIYKNS